MKFVDRNKKALVVLTLMLLAVLLNNTGIRMNQFVIAENGGKMPVIGWTGKSSNPFSLYQNATENTRYVFLADRQSWFGFSIGDLVMFSSIFCYIPIVFILLKQKQETK